MKLETKHLIAYAPYNLNVQLGGSKRNLTAISLDSPFAIITTYPGSRDKEMVNIERLKPILKPKTFLHELHDEIFIRWGGGVSVEAKPNWIKEVTDNLIFSAYSSLTFGEVEFMLEQHIDVFNLIDHGLAIST